MQALGPAEGGGGRVTWPRFSKNQRGGGAGERGIGGSGTVSQGKMPRHIRSPGKLAEVHEGPVQNPGKMEGR